MKFDSLLDEKIAAQVDAIAGPIVTLVKDSLLAITRAVESLKAVDKPDWESLAVACETRRVAAKTLRKAWTSGLIRYEQGKPAQGGKCPIRLWRADLDKHFPIIAK